jgi:two-component system chemotaxis sensor kinase CheA
MVRVGALWLAAPVTGLVRLQRLRDGDLVASGGRLLLAVEDDDDVPAAALGDLLGTDRGEPAVAIVLRAGAEAAVLVEEVAAEVELVVSRLPAPWRRLRFTAGAAISADGEPIVVLGIAEVARAVRRAVSADRIAVPVTAGSVPYVDPAPDRPVVVVADDSATSLTLESAILDHAGYDVRTALDGIDALAIVEAGGVDVVVADLQMPRLSGFELCEHLRADPRFTTLPIVLVSSSASPTDRARGMQLGADAFMVKAGFDRTQLVDLLRSLIGP